MELDGVDEDAVFVLTKLINDAELLCNEDQPPREIENSEFDGEISKPSEEDDLEARLRFFRKLSDDFEPLDVPFVSFNVRLKRYELRRKSSDWIRTQICRMLESNFNPDDFLQNVRLCFGDKMTGLICEPASFADCVAARYSRPGAVRPVLLTRFLDDCNFAWRRIFSASPPPPKPPKRAAENPPESWENFVWNQLPRPRSFDEPPPKKSTSYERSCGSPFDLYRLTFEDRRYASESFWREEFRGVHPEYRARSAYASYRNYSSGYGRDWCSREDVERLDTDWRYY